MRTKLLIEEHFHGCFGVDFNRASVEDVLFLSKEIYKHGIGGIFPTLVTDSIENIKHSISVIKEASQKQDKNSAKILGIHLEGIFLNPEKKGIHNEKYFLRPTVENYKLLEDDFIKIVTLAPELAEKDLTEYLNSKGIKVHAGHCIGWDLSGCSGITHLFNAMSGVHHRNKSTALSALVNDDIYTEIIADGVHVSDEILRLVFKTKPLNKIILVSDCLPCTNSDLKEFEFAGQKIFYDGCSAKSKEGTLAGSTTLLPNIIKRLAKSGLNETSINQLVNNLYEYHNVDIKGYIEWDNDWNINEAYLEL